MVGYFADTRNCASHRFYHLDTVDISNLSAHPRPVQSYTEAVQRVEILRAAGAGYESGLPASMMTHDKKMDRVIILVHGYTNCPHQFHELGQRFYDLGYNVLIAPLPHHGLADRMTEAHAQLTAEELAAYADETVGYCSRARRASDHDGDLCRRGNHRLGGTKSE